MSVARNLFLGREPREPLRPDRLPPHAPGGGARLLRGFGVRVDVRRPLRTLGLGAQQMVALARAVAVDARVVIMDEPTSSLEPREVRDPVPRHPRLRERKASPSSTSATAWTSCTSSATGSPCCATAASSTPGELADLDRLQLVSLMLGRDLAEVRREGVTSSRGATTRPRRTPVLHARPGSDSRHQLHDISVRRTPGEVRRPRRAARLRPQRDGQGDVRRAAAWTRARSPSAAPPCAALHTGRRHPGRHQPAARGPQGRGHRPRSVRPREHRAGRAAPALPGRVVVATPSRTASSTPS